MTLDGKIATSTGHSAWVTGTDARQEVHQLRAACDAVIVGGNTVRRDNPQLTSHHPQARNPLRIVMSRTLDLPTEAHLWETEVAPTLVLTEPGVDRTLASLLQKKQVEVVELAPLTPAKVMAYLYDRQLLSVLWECGGTLAARAIAEGAVQKVLAFIAPKIVGGSNAPSPVGELGLENMNQALVLSNVSWRTIGSDCLVEGYLDEVISNK
jgi:diaminohydroxyphosphoribosylaminopyrimidine deaminase/5-amino-6-(5-phosphoribosylamino)uracil reductase